MNRILVNSTLRRSVINTGRTMTAEKVLVSVSGHDFENFTMRRRRMMSSSAAEPTSKAPSVKGQEEKKEEKKKEVMSYWGISRSKITREDGTEWPWNCFMPWDTYQSNLSIDLSKHHVPKNFTDKFAYRTVKLLRIPTDVFFRRRYGCRAMMLETVAAVPGMVGGMLLHLRSLRKFQQSGGWIKALLEEAENERMHLMTMVELVKPKWYERLLVLAVQGVFFNAFFVIYMTSPKLAHRIVGYLEEEAVHSYTEFLKDIESGAIENVAAPAIAIDYWRLPKDSTLKDVITVIRADEAHHRDVNHFASDIHFQGKELREAPAPVVGNHLLRDVVWIKVILVVCDSGIGFDVGVGCMVRVSGRGGGRVLLIRFVFRGGRGRGMGSSPARGCNSGSSVARLGANVCGSGSGGGRDLGSDVGRGLCFRFLVISTSTLPTSRHATARFNGVVRIGLFEISQNHSMLERSTGITGGRRPPQIQSNITQETYTTQEQGPDSPIRSS
ncbi:ubiquinol oxidase, mitochondrial-like protein [Tanacetum coccineum]